MLRLICALYFKKHILKIQRKRKHREKTEAKEPSHESCVKKREIEVDDGERHEEEEERCGVRERDRERKRKRERQRE